MESIGRDNIKTTNYVIKSQLKENNKFRPIIVSGFVLAILFLTVAYASLAMNFGVKIHDPRPKRPDIHGDDVYSTTTTTTTRPPRTTTKKPNWKIVFENLVVEDGSNTAEVPAHILDSDTDVQFKVKLSLPGDYYRFKVDIRNSGGYNAKIYDIIRDYLTPDQMKYLNLFITYEDGTEIKIDDELPKNTKKTIQVSLEFKEDVTASDLPQTDQLVDISYEIVYVEK